MGKCSDTHFEIERGWPISVVEYNALPARLEKLGFQFCRRLLISDFILPMLTTNRLRFVHSWDDQDNERQQYIRCLKNHPLKGSELEDIRKERERSLRWRPARGFLMRSVEFLRAPIPHYSKVRDEYEGEGAGGTFTVALDHAILLGDKSGHFMEVEATRKLSIDGKTAAQTENRVGDLGCTIIGEKRKKKVSYRKMLMATCALGEEVDGSAALIRLMDQYDDLLPKIRDARSLSELATLGERLKKAGDRALRTSAA